jgi:YVTN family beta-propeller protein
VHLPAHRRRLRICLLCLLLPVAACSRRGFPLVPAGYREFAYVANGAANTVSVLDLVFLRQDRTLQVGAQPSGLAVNPKRDEVYVVNTQPGLYAGSVSVIDTERNQVVATIPVRRKPYSIAVEPSGHWAFVANSGSNSVSILNLDQRRSLATVATGEQPGVARIAPDGRTLVVTNRGSNSISIYDVTPPPPAAPRSLLGGSKTAAGYPWPPLKLRATFNGCPGPTDAVILPDSSKTFVACSGGHQVMAVALAQPPGSWPVRQDPAALTDHFLGLLDVGRTPVQIAMKPDGGEIFTSNFDDDTISEISTWTNEVGGTYPIGSKPSQGIVSRDNSTLWVSNFGDESIALYSIDDGKLISTLHTGAAPDALAFSADEHLLLAADAHSGDVAVLRTQGKLGPALFTLLPAGQSPNAIAVKAMPAKP